MEKKPVIVTVGGSDGGYQFANNMAKELAQLGYTSIAIPYHKFKDLPTDIDRIPLESFQHTWKVALQTIASSSSTKRPLIVIGRSRGAELALLLGSYFQQVNGVVAYAPTSIVWGAPDNLHSSWTHKGDELPFATISSEVWQQALEYSTEEGIVLKDCFAQSIDMSDAMCEIPIEKINGNILLISGKDDLLWPSSDAADRLEARLEKFQSTIQMMNLKYEGVGHCFDIPGKPVEKDDFVLEYGEYCFKLGGVENNIIQAEYDSWEYLIKFLESFSK